MTGHAPAGFRGVFRTDAAARAVYAEGAGIGRIVPRAVAVPHDADDVVLLVRWAVATGVPLVPRGSGSGMASGAIGPGVVVDLQRLDAIGPIDTVARRVVVGAGAVRDAVDGAARAQGLRFPVDPSSGAFCTIGGMAATNAAGAHSLAFGPMRPWVTALDCVFADGSRAWLRRGVNPTALEPEVAALARWRALAPTLRDGESQQTTRRPGVRKESSGYALADWYASGELVDLLVGSEGTLAIFVGVELALAPLASATSSVLATFDTLDDAVRGAREAHVRGAVACELLDRTFLDVVRAGAVLPDLPPGTEAVLLTECEGADAASARSAAEHVTAGFRAAGARTLQIAHDPAAEHALWAVRHAASPILARLDPALRSMQFIEDGAVPPEALPAYVRGVRAALVRQGVRGVVFGHAGDAHVHVNPLVDTRTPDWRARVEALLEEVVQLTASLGGTLSGEHGDGRLRAPLLARTWGDVVVARFAAVKEAFDPGGLLNPGVILPLPGQRAVDVMKYDAALPPLPERARRVLARVERERAYARSRLALLDAEERTSAAAERTGDGEPFIEDDG